MTNKNKIKFLKDEIVKYKQQVTALQSENKDLNIRLSDLEERYFEKEERLDTILEENKTLKGEYDSCLLELNKYKDEYLVLLKELGELKKRSKKQFNQLIGKMRESIE